MSLRILIAVTHLLGVGHLMRAAALSRAFAAAGHDATVASGGMPAPLVRTDGFTVVQLPPVRIAGTDFRTLLDEGGEPVTPARLEARRDMLVELIDRIRPDILVTELFPFGRRVLAGEFMSVVEEVKATRPDALVLASVRDILVAPARPDRIAATHGTLERFYDAVLVHGDPDLIPLDESWPLDEGTRALLRYTGYVDDGPPVAALPGSAGEIVVSGGSSAASLPLYRAAVAAAALVPDRRWRILVGAAAEAELESLTGAAPANAVVERARSDFRSLLGGAAVSVSQAGYNTIIDVLRAGCQAVLVPFEGGNETEQRLRAERLVARGHGELLLETNLSPAALADAVSRALRRPRSDPATIRFDGAERSVAIVEELAYNWPAHGRAPRSRGAGAAWTLLDEALSRLADRQTPLSVWWRDDDAVSHTPALDRLLALARRFDVPLALAAIPAQADGSLAARIAEEPLARVLVHGLAHANHEREGAKKAEFGPARPQSRLIEDAEQGSRLARDRFGDALLPVFVPPWNRIAPEFVPALRELGFRGLSTFGPHRATEPAGGLVQINTHLDPIDWHGGRGLRALDSILADLAAAMTAHPDEGPREPIGLLTHHLAHDEATWAFCETLLARLAGSPSIRFQQPQAMFVGARTPAT
jgi:predicted glycosyltransferase